MNASPALLAKLPKTADAAAAQKVVRRIRIFLTQPQFDALVLYVYRHGNLGTALEQRLNAGDIAGALEIMEKRGGTEEKALFQRLKPMR